VQRQTSRSRHLGGANLVVHMATRAYAMGLPLPLADAAPEWVDCADRHGVLEALVSGMSHQGMHLDPELAMVQLRVGAEHERAARDLVWLSRVLDDAGLPWAVLKGPVLAWHIYPETDARSFGDLDVLVDPRDFGDALTALESAGAELLDRNWLAARQLEVAELSLRLPLGSSLDLHWHVANRLKRRHGFSIRTPELLARRRMVTVRDLPVPTLDGLDTLLHLALHGAHSGGHLLRWLLDVQQTVRKVRPDPQELAERGREQGTALVTRVMLERAANYLEPGLTATTSALARHQPWAHAARLWSRRFPPGCGMAGGLTGRAFFQNLSSGSVDSARRLTAGTLLPQQLQRITRAAVGAPAPAGSRGESVLRAAEAGEDERAAYLALVRTQA
jgi:hypothetical protein